MFLFSTQQLKEQKVAGNRTNEVRLLREILNINEIIASMAVRTLYPGASLRPETLRFSLLLCVQGPLIVTEELHSLSFESELQLNQSGLNIKLEVKTGPVLSVSRGFPSCCCYFYVDDVVVVVVGHISACCGHL